jgi:uncharacterized repeat protein (TIGR03943 family)
MTSSHINTMQTSDKIKIAVLVILLSAVPAYIILSYLAGLATDLWNRGDLAAAAERIEARQRDGGFAPTTVIGMAQRFRETQPQKVAATGMVVRREGLPADQFFLVRYRMTCCAADATPVAVLVHWPGAAGLKENAWVCVLGSTDPAAKVLAADAVEPVKEPANPYL